MIRRVAFLLTTCGVLSFSSAAVAKERIDRLSGDPNYIMWAYAKCLVERDVEGARAVFAQVPQSEVSNEMLEALQWRGCLRKATKFSMQLSFDHTLIRGAMAEHLLESDRKQQSRGRVTDETQLFDANVDLSFAPYESRYDVTFILASECAFAGAQDQVLALLDSQPGTTEEQTAMEELAPLLSPCISDGSLVRMTNPMFRAYVSEAALRIASRDEDSLEAAE